ncbi:MAG TPA: hypothetical protein VMK12_06110 [Anaeromyxobacteraceae bacterium]|nr:hypothetical protein [Anaeromyxobacteraceae bacterium]
MKVIGFVEGELDAVVESSSPADCLLVRVGPRQEATIPRRNADVGAVARPMGAGATGAPAKDRKGEGTCQEEMEWDQGVEAR